MRKLVATSLLLIIFFAYTLKAASAVDVTVTGTVPNTTATLNGFAPASSVVTVKEDGTTVGTATTNPSGTFSKVVVTNPGTHSYSLFYTDTSGRTTPETTFSGVVLLVHQNTNVNDIHLPSTIELSKTSVYNGESVAVFGQGAPGSTVHVFVNGSEKFSGTIGGGSDWSFNLNGSHYIVGSNTIHTVLTRSGLSDSANSHSLILTVGNCRRSDLNCDGLVNLTDFSILLFHWGSTNSTADINSDGTVSLTDFSIMLFDWTG
jgi:hypothetical protein